MRHRTLFDELVPYRPYHVLVSMLGDMENEQLNLQQVEWHGVFLI